MKREIRHTLDGKQIVTLVPENSADMSELIRLESQGLLDMGDSLHNHSTASRRLPARKRPTPALVKAS